MSLQPTDRNLLVALLALQMGFLTRSTFLELVRHWIDDRSQPIENLIRDRRLLDSPTLELLLALMNKHIELHGGSVEQSLASMSSAADLRDDLRDIPSQDLEATIQFLAPRQSREDLDHTQTESLGSSAGSSSQRFRVLRFHAEGGLGRVSVAHDAELNRDVAFKEIKPRYAADEENRVRFVAEAEITGALEHPGIVPVYSLGQYSDGRPYYAMRFIRGDSLKTAVAALHRRDQKGWPPGERQLELRRLLARFIDVCDAIAYAHSRGVLHRDLKPGNIMLGKYGETLVVDWGLAKPVGRSDPAQNADEATVMPRSGDSSRTLAGTLVGTVGYMSPEQAQGRLDLLGPATDVYSLGATLYTILAGQPTFTSQDQSSFSARVAAGDFPPPSQIKPGLVPPALEAICLKALATRCEDRYPNARALADDLERWLADERVSVYREPWMDRLSRTVRNHRTKFAAGAAVVLSSAVALLAILLLVSRQNQELRIARDDAVTQFRAAQREQRRAEANLTVARTWASRLLRFAESTARIPGLGAVRRALTDESLKVLQELARQQNADPELEMELADALRTWANLTWSEDLPRSLQANQEAAAILRRLEAADPSAPRPRDMLSLALQDQGNLLKRTGDFPEALKRFEESLAIAETLRNEFPKVMMYRRTEGAARVGYAALLTQTDRVHDAPEQAAAAVRVLRELALSSEAQPVDASLLVLAMQIEIEALRLAERFERAEKAVSDALAYLAAQPKGDANLEYFSARVRLEQCLILRSDAGRTVESQQAAELGIAECRALIEAHHDSPRLPSYRTLLARLLAQRGALDSLQAKHDAARESFREAIETCDALAKTPTTATREAHSEVLWLAAQAAKRRGDDEAFQTLRAQALELQRALVNEVPQHVPARQLLEQIEAM
ncbi:MAG: protein kinase [Pirellulales bacterium]